LSEYLTIRFSIYLAGEDCQEPYTFQG
jgi:hypothetical protein